MSSEIGTAYIRLRPNTRGFAHEAESGVKGTFQRLGKIAGLAFGAKEAFDFTKEIAVHAADVEKQIRAVKAEFGGASEELLKFGETGAAALGISAHAADTTAARFGIIFENLGIGNEQAAQMTIGFEKLAGSLALIRNVDPAVILKNIPLAIQGNLRSLKQLGIATDQNQLKLAAYKLHLISNVKEGLTPATRAQAIYAIATAHLSQFLAQAGANSGDAATQSLRLAAEWDNAKDKLGKGLLPSVTKLTVYLATNLPSAVDKTIAVFHGIKQAVSPVVDALGGVKATVRDLLVVWLAWKAALKLEALASTISSLITTTKVMRGLVVATEEEAAAAQLLQRRLFALGAIGAIGITIVVAEHVAGKIKKIQEDLIKTREQTAPVKLQQSLVPDVSDQIKAAKKAGESSKKILSDLRARLGDSLKADDLIAQAFRFSTGGKNEREIKAGWKKALEDPSKKAVKDAGAGIAEQISKLGKQQDAAVAKARGDLKQLGVNLSEAVKQEVLDVQDSVRQARSNLTSIGQSLADAIGSVLDKPLQNEQNKLSAIGNRQSLENIRRSVILPGGKQLSTDPRKALAELQSLAKQGEGVNKGAIQNFILQYRQAVLGVKQDQVNVTKEATSKRIADLTDSLNRGTISVATYKKKILALLTRDHVSYKRAGKLLGTAFANGFQDSVKGLFEQAAAVASAPGGKFEPGQGPTIVRPLETLRKDNLSIGKIQHQIGNKTNALLARIAKDTKAQADLQAKLAALELGPLPSKRTNPGKQNRRAKATNATTG